MKCSMHEIADATATCQDCGRGLCAPCTSRFDRVSCQTCLLSHNDLVEKRMYLGLAMTVIIFAGATWFISGLAGGADFDFGRLGKAAFLGLMLAFTYWGWRFLSERGPRVMFASPPMWAIYLFCKLIFAYVIGIFVGPYQIYRMHQQIALVRRTRMQIQQGLI
jgi:hypothetical protein